MSNRTLSYICVSSSLYFAAMGAAAAQTALSSCNPATGLTPTGQQCVTLTRTDPTQYQTRITGQGASNYRPVNVGALAETYQCDRSDPGTGYGTSVTLLIEDCGQPLDLDPSTFEEFVGYSGVPTPAPIAPAPPPPMVMAPPVAPLPAPVLPAPVITAPVMAAPLFVAPPLAAPVLASTGLGSTGLIAAGLGAAALVGIAAVALGGGSSATTTTNN